MNYQELTSWLLAGDVSLQYQTYRDLLGTERHDLRGRIAKEGWGAAFLAHRHPDGHWGKGFYQPKWTSTHYTLLDLRNLMIDSDYPLLQSTVQQIAKDEKGPDGGINPSPNIQQSDVCINGMFLNYACYFKLGEAELKSVIDFLLEERMADGGFNCQANRSGASHSSLHSTLSVLEGLTEYLYRKYTYRREEVLAAKKLAQEFILIHQLFLSDRTGELIKKSFLKLSYPSRWHYDILRALDYFRYAEADWDERMVPAMDVLFDKRTKHGTWKLQANHPGETFFDMEAVGKPSRWNTLRALRVFAYFGQEERWPVPLNTFEKHLNG